MEHVSRPMEHVSGPMERHVSGPMEHVSGPMEHVSGSMEHVSGSMEHVSPHAFYRSFPGIHANNTGRTFAMGPIILIFRKFGTSRLTRTFSQSIPPVPTHLIATTNRRNAGDGVFNQEQSCQAAIYPRATPSYSASRDYSSIITDDPTSVGLTAAIATTLAGYVSDYSTKLTLLETPAERSPVAVQQKDESKRTLSDYIRSTARQIQGTMTVTDAQRTNLRLSVRGNASPINAPTDVPVPEIVSIVGRVVTMNLRALGTDGRAKPAGVDSAAVWTFVGAAPPADITEWEYQGATTKITNFIMTFPASVAAAAGVAGCTMEKSAR